MITDYESIVWFQIIGDTSTLFSDVSNFDFATFKLLDGGLKNDVDDITANVAFYESGIDDFKTLMANNVREDK